MNPALVQDWLCKTLSSSWPTTVFFGFRNNGSTSDARIAHNDHAVRKHVAQLNGTHRAACELRFCCLACLVDEHYWPLSQEIERLQAQLHAQEDPGLSHHAPSWRGIEP